MFWSQRRNMGAHEAEISKFIMHLTKTQSYSRDVLRHDSLPDFPVTPISPPTSRNISIGFQTLLESNIKFCLLFSRPKWGWHLNISVTQSDFRPLPHPFALDAPWKGGSSLSLGPGQPWPCLDLFTVIGPSLWNRLPPSAR